MKSSSCFTIPSQKLAQSWRIRKELYTDKKMEEEATNNYRRDPRERKRFQPVPKNFLITPYEDSFAVLSNRL